MLKDFAPVMLSLAITRLIWLRTHSTLHDISWNTGSHPSVFLRTLLLLCVPALGFALSYSLLAQIFIKLFCSNSSDLHSFQLAVASPYFQQQVSLFSTILPTAITTWINQIVVPPISDMVSCHLSCFFHLIFYH